MISGKIYGYLPEEYLIKTGCNLKTSNEKQIQGGNEMTKSSKSFPRVNEVINLCNKLQEDFSTAQDELNALRQSLEILNDELANLLERKDVEDTIQEFREIILKAFKILSKFSLPLPEQQVVENLNELFRFFVEDFCPFYDSNKRAFEPNENMINEVINLCNKLIKHLREEDFSTAQDDLNAIKQSLETLNDALTARLEMVI